MSRSFSNLCKSFVVSLSNHERPSTKLRANGVYKQSLMSLRRHTFAALSVNSGLWQSLFILTPFIPYPPKNRRTHDSVNNHRFLFANTDSKAGQALSFDFLSFPRRRESRSREGLDSRVKPENDSFTEVADCFVLQQEVAQ